jgi:hypothetical protein
VPLLLPLLALTALAVPADHTVLAETDGCVISIGPPPPEGPRTLRAECTWPEADVAAARAVLLDYAGYGRIISNIRAATVVRQDAPGTLVHQEHDLPLVADREVMLWMRATDRDDGGVEVTWNLADEPFEPEPGNVRVAFNAGRWEVGAAAGGGLHVVHEVAYDPGVRLPDWLVRRYRTNGVTSVMRELRALSAGA